MKFGLKTRVPGLSMIKNRINLRSLVLTHYQRVTDRQTEGHDAYASSSAEHDKNKMALLE